MNTNKKGASALATILIIVILAILAFLIGQQFQKSSTRVSGINSTSTATSTASTTATSTATSTTSTTTSTTTTTTTGALPGRVGIKVGQRATIGGLGITFNNFVQDYRCPVDVQCIQAGAVVINVTFSANGKTKTLNMPSDEVPQQFEGYSIAIRDIKPDLYSGRTIAKGDYIVTFEVSK